MLVNKNVKMSHPNNPKGNKMEQRNGGFNVNWSSKTRCSSPCLFFSSHPRFIVSCFLVVNDFFESLEEFGSWVLDPFSFLCGLARDFYISLSLWTVRLWFSIHSPTSGRSGEEGIKKKENKSFASKSMSMLFVAGQKSFFELQVSISKIHAAEFPQNFENQGRTNEKKGGNNKFPLLHVPPVGKTRNALF